MKRIIFVYLFIFPVISCSPVIIQFYPGKYFKEDKIYQNKILGFALVFRGNWDIITDPNKMKENRSYARELHSVGAELLYIGFTLEKTQGTRCIAYNKNETSEKYAEEIRNANRENISSDSGITAATLNGKKFFTWRYDADGFCFIEYFFNLDTYNVRIAYWTTPELFKRFRPVYDDMIGSVDINELH
jgi:hypothetical protein